MTKRNLVGLTVLALSTVVLFGLVIFTERRLTLANRAQSTPGMPPGATNVGKMWLESSVSADGTYADIAVFASSGTPIRQAIATVEWDPDLALYDYDSPATMNEALHCYVGQNAPPQYIEEVRYDCCDHKGDADVRFWGTSLEECNSISENRTFDWARAMSPGDRIPIGNFRIRGRVDGVAPLKLVFLTAIINQYDDSIGGTGAVAMSGTTVSLKKGSLPGAPTPIGTIAPPIPDKIILNSATDKSCTDICRENGMYCNSVGINTYPGTSTGGLLNRMYLTVDTTQGIEDPDHCKFITNGGDGCSTVMKSLPFASTCSNQAVGNIQMAAYPAEWTYCQCQDSAPVRNTVYIRDTATPTPKPEVTPLVRGNGTTNCQCPLNYSCSADGQSCINLRTVYTCDIGGTYGANSSCRLYCTDGTKNHECSQFKPFACDTLYTNYKPSGLHAVCSRCGCPDGQVCNPDGTCGQSATAIPGQVCTIATQTVGNRVDGGYLCSGPFIIPAPYSGATAGAIIPTIRPVVTGFPGYGAVTTGSPIPMPTSRYSTDGYQGSGGTTGSRMALPTPAKIMSFINRYFMKMFGR